MNPESYDSMGMQSSATRDSARIRRNLTFSGRAWRFNKSAHSSARSSRAFRSHNSQRRDWTSLLSLSRRRRLSPLETRTSRICLRSARLKLRGMIVLFFLASRAPLNGFLSRHFGPIQLHPTSGNVKGFPEFHVGMSNALCIHGPYLTA